MTFEEPFKYEMPYSSPHVRLKLIPLAVPTMKDIAQDVANRHGIAVDDLMGQSRAYMYSHPRQEAFYLCRQVMRRGEPRYSLPQIGRFFDRDHSSVHWGVAQHAKRLAEQ